MGQPAVGGFGQLPVGGLRQLPGGIPQTRLGTGLGGAQSKWVGVVRKV